MAFSNKYKLLLAFVAVAVLAVLYYAVFYPWPGEHDVAGTLTGVEQANRFRADQVGSKDVALDDQTVQKLLQNDKFLTLLKNKQFRETMSQPGVANAVWGLVASVPESDVKAVIDAVVVGVATVGSGKNVASGQQVGSHNTGIVIPPAAPNVASGQQVGSQNTGIIIPPAAPNVASGQQVGSQNTGIIIPPAAPNVASGQQVGAHNTGVAVPQAAPTEFVGSVVGALEGQVGTHTVNIVKDFLSQPGVATFLSQPGVALIFSNPGIVSALTDPSLVNIATNPTGIIVVASPQIYSHVPAGVNPE